MDMESAVQLWVTQQGWKQFGSYPGREWDEVGVERTELVMGTEAIGFKPSYFLLEKICASLIQATWIHNLMHDQIYQANIASV